MWVKKLITLFCLLLSLQAVNGQIVKEYTVSLVDNHKQPVKAAIIRILNTELSFESNERGIVKLQNIVEGNYAITIDAPGYATLETVLHISNTPAVRPVFELVASVKQLDEVIVRSDRKEANLQLVSTSVSSFNEKNIRDYRLWRTEDISALVPNLYSAGPGDGRNVTAIRGIVSTSYDPSVNTAIDGVTQFTLDTYIPQLFDVVSVEVLRGPQGTLYGRNAMGGMINILSRQPSNTARGFAEVSAGNYNTQRYTAGFQTPVIKDKLFFGAALLYHRTNGFYKNELTNSNFDKQNNLGGNYYLKYKPSSRLMATLNVKHLQQNNDGAFTLTGTPEDALSNPFRVQQNATARMKDNTFNTSLVLNYAGRHFNVLLQSAYQSNYRFYTAPLDGDFSPIDGITIINDYGPKWNKVKVFTQELRFSSPARLNSKWQWVGGVYLFSQRSPTKQATHFGKDAVFVGSPDIDYAIINTSTVRNTGAALFGQVIYTIDQRMSIKAGLRYDHQRSRSRVLGEYQPDASPVPVFNTQEDTSAQRSYSAVSPVLSFQYKLTGHNRLFASYSRGYRTGGLTQLSPDPSQPPLFAYRPEYSNSFEIGAKNMFFENRLRLNLAVFYTIVEDAQVPTLILPEGLTVTRNAGRMRSTGVEAELSALLAKGLKLDYNFGYTSAKYTSLRLPKDGQEQDLSGNHQIYSPSTTSMAALNYERELNRVGSVSFQARAEWVGAGLQYFDLANTIKQSPYQLVNAKLGIGFKKWQLSGWTKNLFNQRYIAYAYDFGATRLGNPRTYGVTVQTSF